MAKLMSLLRRENPTPFPEGTRVVTTPFENRGVVHEPSKFICTIILDEPLKHTDRVRSSWEEVHRESDYDIAAQQEWVDRAKAEVDDINRRIAEFQKYLATAQADLRRERATLREVRKRYS